MNFMGSGMSYLFGVCHDDCTTKANDAIDRTERNGNNILHIMKQQTTVVKTAMKQISVGMNQIQSLYKELREKEKAFVENLNILKGSTDIILHLLKANAIQNMYTLLTNQYAYETSTLNQIVTAARARVIHSSLMTITDIAHVVKKINSRVDKKQLEVPMGTKPSKVYELLKVTKMTVFYGNNRIIFVTKIPLVTSTELTTYNVIPISVRRPNDAEATMQILDPETPFIAITKNRKEYTPISKEQMDKCTETNIYRICPMTLPMLINNLLAPCEVYFFNEPKEGKTEEMKCKIRTASLKKNLFHKLRYTNEWIYSVYYDQLIVTCTSLSEPQIKIIRGEGIIKLSDNDCQVRTTNGVLEPEQDLATKNYTNFIPRTNMTKLFENLPNNTLKMNMRNLGIYHDIRFTDMRQATKSLEEIEGIINSEQEREENYARTKHHSIMLYVTMGLAVLSIMLILIIYIMTKCHYIHKKCHSRRRSRYPPMYAMQPVYPNPPTAPNPLPR